MNQPNSRAAAAAKFHANTSSQLVNQSKNQKSVGQSPDLRTRIAAVQRSHRLTSFGANYVQCECGWKSPEKYATWTDHPEHVADAVIRELEANCIYRYACAHCGDFWFDKSERMQRFALLHGKAHTDDR